MRRLSGTRIMKRRVDRSNANGTRFDYDGESEAAKSLRFSSRHRGAMAGHGSYSRKLSVHDCNRAVPDVELGGSDGGPTSAPTNESGGGVDAQPPSAPTTKDPSQMAPQDQARYYTGQIHEGRMATLLTNAIGGDEKADATASMEAEVVQRLIYFEHLFFQLDPYALPRG